MSQPTGATAAPQRVRGRPRTTARRITVGLPAEVLADVEREAEARGTTLSEEIVRRCRTTVTTIPASPTGATMQTITIPGVPQGSILDIARQAFPGRQIRTNVGTSSFTGVAADLDIMCRELDAHGIDWGWQ